MTICTAVLVITVILIRPTVCYMQLGAKIFRSEWITSKSYFWYDFLHSVNLVIEKWITFVRPNVLGCKKVQVISGILWFSFLFTFDMIHQVAGTILAKVELLVVNPQIGSSYFSIIAKHLYPFQKMQFTATTIIHWFTQLVTTTSLI